MDKEELKQHFKKISNEKYELYKKTNEIEYLKESIYFRGVSDGIELAWSDRREEKEKV